MVYSIIFLLSVSVCNINGETRYFIEASTNTETARSRPLDICHQNSNGEFTIYSCDTSDPTKHVLIAENHGINNPFCDSPNPSIDRYYNNDTNTDIDEDSFNCVGEDNYAIIYEFTNETLCRDYLNSNKKEQSNDNMDTVKIIYRATNICYHHNAHNITVKEELLMHYCNAFYISYRLFEYGSNCINDLKSTFPSTPTSIGRTFSPNICSTDQMGDVHYSSIIMHTCIIDNTSMNPYDYNYDSTSLKQITIDERIGLIDWMVSSGDMNNLTYYPWAEYFCHKNEIGGWNLIEITEKGNIYQSDDETPICGILLRDPGDIYTNTIYGFLDIIDGLLEFDYNDPFIRNNVNPLNKTIVYGLDFYFDDIAFGGSIPDTICNLHNLHYLSINAAKGMYGTIPECIGNDLDIHRLQLITLENITGTIPSSLCNVQNYHLFWMINLRNLTGTIPQCFGDINYRSLNIWRNEKLSGILPENMFCGYHLVNINFHNNSNMTAQNIPLCWSEPRPFLMFVIMPYSKLYGTMPKMPRVDYTTFAWLELQGNELEGSVTDIFGDMQKGALSDSFANMGLNFKFLQVFMIHNNLFHDNDITHFLEQIFSENEEGITVFSMSNNKYITGTLPDINVTIKDAGINRKWTGLLLHDLDLYGTIPQQMQLGGIDYLTLHNNRLSGYIPDTFKDIDDSNPNITTSAIVLLGNLLWTKQLQPPEWVNSQLRSANNMYYNPIQQIEGILIVIFGFIGILIGILYCLMPQSFEKKLFHHKMELFEKKLPIILFFDTMQTLRRWFAKENVIFFWFILILTIFYSLTSNYYAKVPHESMFALPWYWIDPNNNSKFVYLSNTFLLIIALIFNWLLFRLVHDMNALNKQTEKEMKANRKEFGSSLRLKIKETVADDTPITNDDNVLSEAEAFCNQLPNGWRKGFTLDGRLYYINDITKETQWSKPEALPNEWQIRYTQNGRLFYQNDNTKRTQWERPEILPPLPREWNEAYTVDGRAYYVNHSTKETQWERPTLELHEIKDTIKDVNNDVDDDDIALEIIAEPKCKSLCKMIIYLIMWVIALLGVMSYILSSSLPDDNTLKVPSWALQLLAKLLPLILVLNNKYIIPGLASGISGVFCDGTKGKYAMILIFELNNEIILPFVGSLILLNDCGKYWVNFWTLCVDPVKRAEHFDILLENGDRSYTTLLRSEEVCGSPSFLDMDFNKCIRSFLYNWTAVMMSQLVVGVGIELCSFLWNIRKHKKQQNTDKKESKKISIHMDGQYMSITMSLLISIAFSFCAPIIIPINLLDIFIKSILFKSMRYKYEWKFDIKHASYDQTLPVQFLWIGLGFNQLFTVLFCIWCLEHGMVFGGLIALGLVVMDIYIINMKCKGRDNIFLRDRFGKNKMKDIKKADGDVNQEHQHVSLERTSTVEVMVYAYHYDDYWKCDVCTMVNENSMTDCRMCNTPHDTIQYPNLQKEEAKQEVLPIGWSVAYTDDQKKYYQNDLTKQTQWEKPTQPATEDQTELVKDNNIELVDKWTVMYRESDGKKYYQNNITKETSWNKPYGYIDVEDEGGGVEDVKIVTVIKVESKDESLSIPKGWSVMFRESDGKKYYQNNITKTTSWDIPKKMENINADDLSLPEGWSKLYSEKGKIYYQNDKTMVTQWIHPTEKNLGWMKRYTNDGQIYYQNEITKETQWDKPTQYTD